METRTILLIDDSPVDRELFARSLGRDPEHRYRILEAETGCAGLQMAASNHVDCVVLDYNLPDSDGVEVLRELRGKENGRELPVVMMTGVGSEALAAAIMKEGSQDYLVKGYAVGDSIRNAVDGAIEKVRLRAEIERKRQALAESQRQQLALRDRFFSHVSHELRTPLAAVHQFLSLCLDGLAGELTGTQREYLEIAFRNTEQLKRMIADLMELTRAQEGKLRIDARPVDIAALPAEAVEVLRSKGEAKGVALSFDAGVDGLPPVVADPTRVRQLLVNLIENAIKFTPEGGSVTVTVLPHGEGFVRVSVIDTGCGISKVARRQIFERLHQVREQSDESRSGLGLGLAICSELARLQGGEIWVESEEGRGSAFHFTLPVFILHRMIRSAVTREGELRERFGLVRVELGPLDPAAAEGPSADQVASIRRLLRKFVYYKADVLVPRAFPFGNSEAIYVVAATEEDGVDAMRSRIDRGLHEHCAGKLQNVRIRVQGIVQEVSEEDRALPLEDGIRNVSHRLAAVMRSQQHWGDD